MKISVIGCGRWGSFICWYLDRAGHLLTLYGREGSQHFSALRETRTNGVVTLPDSIALTDSLKSALESDIIVISVNSQGLRSLMEKITCTGAANKTYVLCMKGLEMGSGKRLSEIVSEYISVGDRIAVWLGPGHVQEFCAGIPNCMVIDSEDDDVKQQLIDAFSSELIRFYYGADLIGNEVGAAAKNVIGIAAGMLDGLGISSLKGALMSRATREIARLISAIGGNELSAYGLCHLGDYEATVFSQYSHNRRYGENFVRGEKYYELAEGCYTASALMTLAEKYQVELPICAAVYDILYQSGEPSQALGKLFSRSLKKEF